MFLPKDIMSKAVVRPQGLKDLPMPSWWLADLPSTHEHLSAIPWSSIPHSLTSSPPRRDYFTFYLLLMCFASTIQTNFSTGCNISPSSTSRPQRIQIFQPPCAKQKSSFAPKRRSAETQPRSRHCHGLLVQLNWKLIRASKPSQGTGKFSASPLCSFSPASGVHKLYPDGEKLLFAL